MLVVSTVACQAAQSLTDNVPKPDVLTASATPEVSGPTHALAVQCTCKNDGKAGYVQVTAKLNAEGSWEETESVYMEEGETRVVDLLFTDVHLTEVSPGQFEFSYGCSAEPDKSKTSPSQ
jgi:hypothetical protein